MRRRRLREDDRRLLLHRLCRDFGAPFIHPDFLAPCLTENQFADWQDYYELEPWGTFADDYRAALIAWAAVGPPARRKSPDHYMPQWGGKDPMTPEEYKSRAAAAHQRAASAE